MINFTPQEVSNNFGKLHNLADSGPVRIADGNYEAIMLSASVYDKLHDILLGMEAFENMKAGDRLGEVATENYFNSIMNGDA